MNHKPTDIDRLAESLQDVQERARGLRWAKERPWRLDTHLWFEEGIVVIDLHDLNAALAKRVLNCVSEVGETLACGGALVITGRGRHSVGVPVLRQAISGILRRMERDQGWRHRDVGGGRVLVVVDEGRIPGRYRAGMPVGINLFFVVFLVALASTLPPPIAIPLAGVALWFLWITFRGVIRRLTQAE